MPNSQTEHPQELIAAQIIDDPFSMEFMEQANTIQVSADSLSSLPKRRSRVVRDKFVLHKDLKKRLIKLTKSQVAESAKEIATAILELKYVPTEGKYCNYLGLSQADYTKISYVDKEREERLSGQETVLNMIQPGSIIRIYKQKYYRRDPDAPINNDSQLVRFQDLRLTARHLSNRSYPIRKVEKSDKLFTQEYHYRLGESTPPTIHSFSYDQTFLEGPDDLHIQHSRVIGSHDFTLDSNGLRINSNWSRILGIEFLNTEVKIQEIWNFKKRYHTSIGKIVRRLFGDKYSDREVTAFAEAYTSLITVSNPMYDFEIIEGEEIVRAYHESNYYALSGTLGNSCMRYDRCKTYFQMYTKYPDKVKMAVLRRGSKVAARSIMWNIDGKFMFDRIYYTNNETHDLLKNTLVTAGYETLFQKSGTYSLKIDLFEIDQFPYVDTLARYYLDSMTLTNDIYKLGPYYEFRSTGGDYYSTGQDLECPCCGDTYNRDSGTYVDIGEYAGETVCNSCSVYSEMDDICFTVDDPYESSYCGDYIYGPRAVSLFDGRYAHQDDDNLQSFENEFGLFISNDHFYYEHDGRYYHPKDPNIPAEAVDCNGVYLNPELHIEENRVEVQEVQEVQETQQSEETQESQEII